jgi:hypothetical protein
MLRHSCASSIDVDYRGHHFQLDDQLGDRWCFVRDPSCPDARR